MKLKINFLFYLASLLAGLALGYLFSRETISNTPSPDKTTDSNQIQGIEHLIRENASLALEADALVEEMAALTQTISKLEIQLNKYVKSGDKKIDAKQTQDERYLKKKLKEYTTMLDLTPHQQNQVEGWLRERVFIEESVKSILTDAQLQIYEKHLAHEKNVLAARGANYELNKYPVTINLSEDQKDLIYQNILISDNLYNMQQPKRHLNFTRRWKKLKEKPFNRENQELIWAAEDVISEEQMKALIQSFKRSK